MKIQTVNYPAPVNFPVWNQGDTYFRVNITGATGRLLRYVNCTCEVGGSFDNLAFGISSDSGSPGGYVQNGVGRTGGIGPWDGLPGSPWWFSIGVGPGGFAPGAFQMDIEIETGIETGEYVPLAESGLSYEVQTLGTPNIEEVGGPAPPPACFWTDLVRVTQVCEPGEDPPPPVGGNFQITTTGAEWPHINSGVNADPARLLVDFSGCADAALPIRVHVPSFAATNAFSFSFCSGYYGGGGTWIGGGPDASNAATNTGDAFSEWAPTPFTTDVSSDTLPLFYFEVGQGDYTAPIGLAFDLLFEVYDDGAWRPMDGTGAQVTLIDVFSLAVISEDPVADGYLEITY